MALALRAGTIRERGRFLVRELARRRETHAYRLRRNGLTVLIRHSTPDVVTLGEVFHRPDYEFPAAVEELLGSHDRELDVLDLGANIGLFSLWVLGERPRSRIAAFEPDPANVAILREVVKLNGVEAQVEVVAAAAGNEDGEVSFDAGQFALSRIADDGGTRVPSVDVLGRVARADLLKLDIEGGEWAILLDPRFAADGPAAVVLEYHPHLAPTGADPRQSVQRRLLDCGYELADISHRPDGHGMLWAWRG